MPYTKKHRWWHAYGRRHGAAFYALSRVCSAIRQRLTRRRPGEPDIRRNQTPS